MCLISRKRMAPVWVNKRKKYCKETAKLVANLIMFAIRLRKLLERERTVNCLRRICSDCIAIACQPKALKVTFFNDKNFKFRDIFDLASFLRPPCSQAFLGKNNCS